MHFDLLQDMLDLHRRSVPTRVPNTISPPVIPRRNAGVEIDGRKRLGLNVFGEYEYSQRDMRPSVSKS
jgi:hypothetical protein